MLPLITLRLQNQLLVQPPFDAPQQVVEWMGAVQAQDYRMAKWAVGCRTASTDATQIEAALNRGDILRTHLLRPTWHFVSSKDLRWMLSLTADRIRAANDSYARGTDAALDSKSIHRYMNLLQKTLEGNKHRTKEEIGEALNQRGIPLSQYALRHLLMRAETDGIVCSGADKKGTATYALLDERAPHGEEPSREEALARLARIYFRSHSPATLADFTWWSGLTATEARRAVASIAEELTTEHFGDREFFVFRNAAAAAPCDTTHLLPAYDQYLIGYKDRSGVLAKEHLQSLQLPRNFPTGYPLRRTDRRQLETNRRTRERHHTNDLMGKCRPQSTGCRHRTVPFVHRRNKVGKQSGGFVK